MGEGRWIGMLAGAVLAAGPAGAARVGNVAVTERPGVAEVTYDLLALVPCLVTLAGSEDGGETFTLRVTAVEGDVGPAVAPGTGRRILWRVSADYPDGLAGRDVLLDVVAEEEEPEFTEEERAAASCLDAAFTPECATAIESVGRRHPWFLVETLGYPDPAVRAGVAEVLGRLGYEEAVPALLDLLEGTPLPEGDNTVTLRERRKVTVAERTVRERYATVRNR